MRQLLVLVILLPSLAWAGYTIIPTAGDYHISGGSVILHEVAPVKIASEPPPVVEPDVPPAIVTDPPIVVPPPTDEPPVIPPTDAPPSVVVPDTPPVVEPPVVVPDEPPVVPPAIVGKVIQGGNYSTPVVISAAGTYTVAGDMTCDSTCIDIKASGVTLDLGGKTLTYNQVSPGEGVKVSAYNRNTITVQNGSIVQGAANSEGDVYGRGNNPILATLNVWKLTVRNITATYSGRDVGGFYCSGNGMLIENNTLNDLWTVGTIKNRHQGIRAIETTFGAKNETAIVRYNTINGARQIGISAYQNAQIHNNTININSMSTNSAGVNVGPGGKVYDNKIVGRGEHPIGIFYSGASVLGVEVFGNDIDLQVTALGEEYSDIACRNGTRYCGNYANGFRTSWNAHNVNVHDNKIVVRANARYPGKYNPTGEPVIVDGKARGIMAGSDYANQYALFYNNDITAIDETPGLGTAIGLGCSANTGALLEYRGNKVTTNGTHVAFGDYYGKCLNYPIVADNEFIAIPGNPKYQTFEAAWEGYSDGTGRVLQNTYTNGASPDKINLWPAKRGAKSVYFGREVPGAPAQANLPFDGTDAVYEYRLYNSGGKLLREDFYSDLLPQ